MDKTKLGAGIPNNSQTRFQAPIGEFTGFSSASFDQQLTFWIGNEQLRHRVDLPVSLDRTKVLFRVESSRLTVDPRFVMENLANAIVARFSADMVDGHPTRVALEAVIRLDEDALAHFVGGDLRIFAVSLEKAWIIHDRIAALYGKGPDPAKAIFFVIQAFRGGYDGREVEGSPAVRTKPCGASPSLRHRFPGLERSVSVFVEREPCRNAFIPRRAWHRQDLVYQALDL